jgi:hypothetical protein
MNISELGIPDLAVAMLATGIVALARPGRYTCYCVDDWRAVPEVTEWQRIGNQIDAAMIPARADFGFRSGEGVA